MKHYIYGIVFLLVLVSLFTSCETVSSNVPTDPIEDLIVDASWLNSNLSNSNLVLIDARGFPPKNDSIYKAGHIKGAINATYTTFMRAFSSPKVPGWGNILPADSLSPKLATLGLDASKTIVVYGDNDATDPARFGQEGRLVWTFWMAGLTNAKMLDGGFRNWVAQGYPTETTVNTPIPSTFSVASLDQSFTTTTAYVKNHLNSSTVIIDSRTKDEYDGVPMWNAPRDGHYPGAIHFFFANVLNSDNTFKTGDAIEALLTASGIKKTDDIVIYCTSGIRSAHLTMVMRILGYTNAKNHDDSFMVWASDPTLPLETKDE